MKEITSTDELNSVIAATAESPVFLFKHSTRCAISARANARVQEYLASAEPGSPEFHMVKVVESRPVSSAAAETLGVPHQSPQLILVDRGKAVWNKSHWGITAENIHEALAKVSPHSASAG